MCSVGVGGCGDAIIFSCRCVRLAGEGISIIIRDAFAFDGAGGGGGR